MPHIEPVVEPEVGDAAPSAPTVPKAQALPVPGMVPPVIPTTPAAPAAPAADSPAVETAKGEAAKAVNDEIIKVISGHFLEFRKKVSMMFKPEVGVIDDMIVTWQNRYVQQQDPASNVKEGKLNVVIYLKTVPDEKTRTQGYNSFTIDAKMNFTSDAHPSIELEAQAKKKSEEVTAAAAAADAAANTPQSAPAPTAAVDAGIL
jgi:hypothetical protein